MASFRLQRGHIVATWRDKHTEWKTLFDWARNNLPSAHETDNPEILEEIRCTTLRLQQLWQEMCALPGGQEWVDRRLEYWLVKFKLKESRIKQQTLEEVARRF